MQNLLLEIPYKFKKSYGGTPEPQTTQRRMHRPGYTDPLFKKSRGGSGRVYKRSLYKNLLCYLVFGKLAVQSS